jgi:hypothetical protein
MLSIAAHISAVPRKILLDTAVMLVIALVSVIGFKLSPMLVPRAEKLLTAEPGCNLQRAACSVVSDEGSFEISLAPQPIATAKPLRIEVRTSSNKVSRIDADFAGVGMNMGYFRPALQAHGDGLFAADLSLPVCISGHMLWDLTLLVETGTTFLVIPLRFSTPDTGTNPAT